MLDIEKLADEFFEFPDENNKQFVTYTSAKFFAEYFHAEKQRDQEPVAWKYKTNKVHTWITEVKPPDDAYDGGTLTPLYTSPQPAQSLQSHDNEVIEKCAKVCDEMDNEYGWGCVAASTIRLMKGK